jgi:hypothetical protein
VDLQTKTVQQVVASRLNAKFNLNRKRKQSQITVEKEMKRVLGAAVLGTKYDNKFTFESAWRKL